MLQLLELKNVGPAPQMRLDFGKRLNLLTGDNGLGKSFILDIAWWALTRNWAHGPAKPDTKTKSTPSLAFSFDSTTKKHTYASEFIRRDQRWTSKQGRPANPGLVIYARVDGGFSVWDPARNYWKTLQGKETPDRPPAYHFGAQDVWDGLRLPDGKVACNGVLIDWVKWQLSGSPEFSLLQTVLLSLSPSGDEPLKVGRPAKFDFDDAREVPTITMPYGQDVPINLISMGMKRVIALAYLLVWAVNEHNAAADFLGLSRTRQFIFLIDEIESHLHPKWQRVILRSLLDVVSKLAQTGSAEVQLVTSTHSPLVLASVEPYFEDKSDAWFDIDLVPDQTARTAKVVLTKRQFIKRGDASNWLTSEAFDMGGAGSKDVEVALDRASGVMSNESASISDLDDVEKELHQLLPDTDQFWRRWKIMRDRRGAVDDSRKAKT